MSKPQRDAYHAARLLQNELTRLEAKRMRAITKANSDFQLDLLGTIRGADPATLKLVRQVLREDVTHRHVSFALETAHEAETDDDAHERQTDAPTPMQLVDEVEGRPSSIPPPPPSEPELDGNERWGLRPAPRVLAGALDVGTEPSNDSDLPPGYRYPEPGEPATQLPDGRVVALEDGAPP